MHGACDAHESGGVTILNGQAVNHHEAQNAANGQFLNDRLACGLKAWNAVVGKHGHHPSHHDGNDQEHDVQCQGHTSVQVQAHLELQGLPSHLAEMKTGAGQTHDDQQRNEKIIATVVACIKRAPKPPSGHPRHRQVKQEAQPYPG